MLSVLICFQHTTTIIRVNPSKNNSTESQNLPAIPQITPTINSNFPSTAKAQPPKRVYPLYLWPRSKVWMRALKASIQPAATKVTNMLYLSYRGRLLCPRQIPIFVTLLLYILIPPVKKNNTSVMVLPQQKYYNKIIGNVVQKIAFKAH